MGNFVSKALDSIFAVEEDMDDDDVVVAATTASQKKKNGGEVAKAWQNTYSFKTKTEGEIIVVWLY